MNKVEKIKAYLERRIAEIRDISQGYIADKQMKTEYLLLHELLSYIDSLSDTEKDFGIKEELVSENTQFAQMADKYEQQVLIGEYQMKESVAHHCRLSYYLGLKDGAQWQKQQDQSTIELAEDHAMLAGMEKMKQEIMKNVVLETKVMKDNDGDGIDTPYEEWLTLEDTEIPFIPDNIGLKDGDKVKVIIIKQ